jgi:hypothetical protein
MKLIGKSIVGCWKPQLQMFNPLQLNGKLRSQLSLPGLEIAALRCAYRKGLLCIGVQRTGGGVKGKFDAIASARLSKLHVCG